MARVKAIPTDPKVIDADLLTEFFNSVGVRDVELEKEKWEMGDEKFDKLVTEARDYIQSLEEAIQDEQEKLDSA